jgi:uncharacterized Zn-finger protein
MSSKIKDTIHTKSSSVQCNGGEGADNHPLVYLAIKKDVDKISCPYCSKEFLLERLVSLK